jgi:hypothetical protein
MPPTARLEYGRPIVPKETGWGAILKQSLNKTSRQALARKMIAMCSLSGWQATTLNPGMSNDDKMSLLTTRFSKVALTDDPEMLYDSLLGLAATTMGWAQAIAKQRAQEKSQRRAKEK